MNTLTDDDLELLDDRLRNCFGTVMPTLDEPSSLATSAGRGRSADRRRWWAAAAGLILIVGGVVALSKRNDHGSIADTAAVSSTTVQSSTATAEGIPGPVNVAFPNLVAPLLPSDFEVIFRGRTMVTAYNASGVRLDVRVGIGLAEQARKETDGMGGTFPGPGAAVTPFGDIVSVVARAGVQLLPVADLGIAGPDIDALANTIAERIDEPTRTAIGNEDEPVLGTRELSDQLRSLDGQTVFGWGSQAIGNLYVQADRNGRDVAIATMWAPGIPVPTRTIHPADGYTVRLSKVGHWAVVISTEPSTDAAVAPLSDDDLTTVADQVSRLVADRSIVTPAPACFTVTNFDGSIDGLAASNGVSVEALYAANPDLGVGTTIGSKIAIPCGGQPEKVSPDQSGLEAFADADLDGIPVTATHRVAGDTQVYVIGAGMSATGEVRIAIHSYFRANGTPVGASDLPVTSCTEPIDFGSQPIERLEAVPFTCGRNSGTLNLLTEQVKVTPG